MPRLIPLQMILAAPAILLGQTAFADLTPAEVWGDWQQYMEGMGYQVTATETTSAGNLTVSGINLSFEMPDAAGSMAMSLGTIDFVQNPDGSVAILMPDTLPMNISGVNGETGDTFAMSMRYVQSGQQMTASGSPQKLTYDYDAQTVQLTLDQLQVGDDTYGEENAKLNFEGANLSSSTTMTIGDTRGYEQTGGIDALSYDIFINNPEESAKVALNGSVEGLGMTGVGTLPLLIPDTADMAAMLDAGFDIDGAITFSGGSSDVSVQDDINGNFAMQTSSQGGSLSVKLGKDGIGYTVSQDDTNVLVNVAELPFPIEMAMARSAFEIAMPVSKSDHPQDFKFGLTLGEFTMSDMIWSIFDPAGQLPRDPATIVIGLAGKAKLLVDYMNPDAAAQMGDAQPAELESLTLNSLILNAVGARLNGTGAVTFDGQGPQVVPGLGNPVGAVDITLEGANGLIDTLVTMGLLPQDQAMGARMMMGLFAVPGDGPDSLKSKIEMTADGQILANGQRIR